MAASFYIPTPPRVEEFGGKISRANAVVIGTPEYKNGYPGVHKNALGYGAFPVPASLPVSRVQDTLDEEDAAHGRAGDEPRAALLA